MGHGAHPIAYWVRQSSLARELLIRLTLFFPAEKASLVTAEPVDSQGLCRALGCRSAEALHDLVVSTFRLSCSKERAQEECHSFFAGIQMQRTIAHALQRKSSEILQQQVLSTAAVVSAA